MNILEKFRKLNCVMSESVVGYVSFADLCDIMNELLESDICILSQRGKVLASKFKEENNMPMSFNEDEKAYEFNANYNKNLLTLHETKDNLDAEAVKKFYEDSQSNCYHTIVPIINGGKRVATMIAVRENNEYQEEDIAILEYGATIIGIEVARGIAIEEEREQRLVDIVSGALETLSYSELDAVTKIFNKLDGDEGLLVASKIADNSGITRSVIVNALRKLESAGVIESRSLGMKGTRIKIINKHLRDEIAKMDF